MNDMESFITPWQALILDGLSIADADGSSSFLISYHSLIDIKKKSSDSLDSLKNPDFLILEQSYLRSLEQTLDQMTLDFFSFLPTQISADFIFDIFQSISLSHTVLHHHKPLHHQFQSFVQKIIHHTPHPHFLRDQNPHPHLLDLAMYYGSPSFDFILPDLIDCMIFFESASTLFTPSLANDLLVSFPRFPQQQGFSSFHEYIQSRQFFYEHQQLATTLLPFEHKNKTFRL